MKKILLCFMVVTAMALLYSCQQSNGGKCHIVGTVHGEAYEGKRIFLVPLNGPATAETVDSMEIKDGKFHFEPDSVQMYKILLDYHYRAGLQQLIVVSEPGTISRLPSTALVMRQELHRTIHLNSGKSRRRSITGSWA